MKLTRREFLKGGTLLVACLVAGLKPTEPEIIKSGWVDLPVRYVSVMFDGVRLYDYPLDSGQIARAFRMPPYAIYGGAAGAGKTPHPDDFVEAYFAELTNAWLELEFLRGDPAYRCLGVYKEDT